MKLIVVAFCLAASLSAQTLSPQWEELTAGDFEKAIQQARNTCVLPFGILEKHGRTCRWVTTCSTSVTLRCTRCSRNMP